MTTPSTVSPERSLFLASVRKEMMSRSTRSISLPRCVDTFRSGHDRLAFAKLASQEFRELGFDQPEGNGDRPQQLPVLDPDDPVVPLSDLFCFVAGRALGPAFGRTVREDLHVVAILRADLGWQRD